MPQEPQADTDTATETAEDGIAPEADSAENDDGVVEGLMGPPAEGDELDLLAAADGGSEVAAALGAEIAELKDKVLRAMAETENMRRRAQRDREDATKYAIAGFAADMVSVADNLGRALASVAAEARAADPSLDALMTGVEMTERDLLSSFERHGIKAIEAEGKRFDHNLHEAMFEIENPELPAGTVVQVVQGGYTIRDRLLRPAKVGVSKGGPRIEAGAPENAAGEARDGQKDRAKAYEQGGAGAGGTLDEEL